MDVSSRRKRQSGMSLPELMVGLAIVGVVTSQAFGMLSSQLQTYHSQARVLDAQEDSRLAADMILTDIRMAGFMVPNIAGIATVNGGASAADVLCVSEWSSMDDLSLSNASTRFDRASLSSAMPAGSSVQLTASDMDVDGDGDDDFAVDSGIIISNGSDTHCARITRIVGTTVFFTPASPHTFGTVAARAVPAIVYEVNGTNLLRNNLLLSTQVEDLQVQFDVDQDNDDAIDPDPLNGEAEQDDLDGLDHTEIKQVRLFVLTRTSAEDTVVTGVGAGRPAVADRAASGTADDYRRRLVTVTVAPRNLL